MARFTQYNSMRHVGGFLSKYGTSVPSINKYDLHDNTEILLKVALNTINQTNHRFLDCNGIVVEFTYIPMQSVPIMMEPQG